ncbi:MAG: AMP-binding protein [Paracoccaceae bacterium]
MTVLQDDLSFCLCADGLRTRGDLWADVALARRALAGHDAVCNMIGTRYQFAVALLAAMANGQIAAMPSAKAEEAIFAAVHGFRAPKMLDRLLLPECVLPSPAPSTFRGPARMFTSGSTGKPVAHTKDWAALAGGSKLTSDLITRAGLDLAGTLLVGTTPPQHMYGMEAALFAGIAHGHCLADQSVFFPADLDQIVRHAAKHGFHDIVLVTTPPHLRYLESEIRRQPAVRCVLSATAPLHGDLADRLEDGGARHVFEIYGSTETGSMAWRRTVDDAAWALLEGFSLFRDDRKWAATCPHLCGEVPLADEIELLPDGRFHLLGRTADMVRIAGKRHSLGALNAMLATLDEIADSVVLRQTEGDADRLQVFVVPRPEGPSDPRGLCHMVRAHMLRHVDPVFVPKGVTVVQELPRNDTGKVTIEAMQDLVEADTGRKTPAESSKTNI